MRNALLLSAALFSLGAVPALAQMNPAPNATAPLDPTLPGTTAEVPGRPGMTGMRPMRGQQDGASQSGMGEMPRPMRGGRGDMMQQGGGQRGMDRSSDNARSESAPRLPNPGASDGSAESYVAAAQRALAAGRTGAAQEALERAETRMLTRSTEPNMAGSPSDLPMVRQISDARRALANRDTAGARAALGSGMEGGGSDGGRSTVR